MSTTETSLMLTPPPSMAGYLPPIDPAVLNRALMGGDLAQLAPEEKQTYYLALCYTCGLNPLTRPFGVIKNEAGEQVWYATKECAEQLRKLHRVSVRVLDRETLEGDLYCVTVRAWMPSGRLEEAQGIVPLSKASGQWRKNEKTGKSYFEETRSSAGEPLMVQLRGKERADAMHRAETKAKRRATLALCGLGLPEAEAGEVVAYDPLTGEIFEEMPGPRNVTPTPEGALDAQAAIADLFDVPETDPRKREPDVA